jgi:hypothetical protein
MIVKIFYYCEKIFSFCNTIYSISPAPFDGMILYNKTMILEKLELTHTQL